MEDKDLMKTGTTTVGIKCKDGIVLAADKRATAGDFIATKDVDKIIKINDRIAITTAGSVSDIQLLTKLIKAELKLKELRTNRDVSVKEAANLLSGMVYSNIRQFSMVPGISHFLFAGVDSEGFSLYDIYPDGSLQENKEFVSSGSGSVMAYGVLETLYNEKLSLNDAISLGIKSVNAAIQRDSATGNGLDVFTITKEGVKKALTKELKTRIEA